MSLREIVIFGGMATALHVGAFSLADRYSGPDPSGDGAEGEAALTLAPASDQTAALVERWERPPEASPAPEQKPPPEVPEAAEAALPPLTPIDPPPVRLTRPAPHAAPMIRDEAPTVTLDPPPARIASFAMPPAMTSPEALDGSDPDALPSVPDRTINRIKPPPAPTLPSRDDAVPIQPVDPPPAGLSALKAPPSPVDPNAPTPRPSATPSLPDAPIGMPTLDTFAPTPPEPPARPAVDTSPSGSEQAVVTSLRPMLRPEGLVRPAEDAARNTRQPDPVARPAQRAAGGAETRTAPAPDAGISAAQGRRDEANWKAQLANAALRALRYPSGTRATGTATIRFSITPGGQVTGVGLVRSAGHARLDRAAIQTIQRARFPRAPKSLTQSRYTVQIGLRFAP